MKKKYFIVGAVIIVILAIIIGYNINMITHPFNQIEPYSNYNQDITPNQNNKNNIPNKEEFPEPNQKFPKSQIIQAKWMIPEKTASQHLFLKDHEEYEGREINYYKNGEVLNGKYKGGNIFIVTIPAMGNDEKYRFINQSGKITLITQNSAELYDGDFFDRDKFSLDNTSIFLDLIFPEKITYNGNNFSLEGDNLNEPFFYETYNLSNLKTVFIDPKLGNVYTDFPNKKPKEDIKQNGFYLKAPDGTIRTYSLDINFYDKDHNIPQITWNEGLINITEYIYTDIGGCGSKNYASVMYGLSTNNLTAIGKTSKEDTIYELKDQNNPILQDIYTNDYNPYDGKKITYSEFIKSKPVFFWFDPFGRLIKFQKSEFIPQSECAKPVIYLYPEKTTNISVKITPRGGLTKTEPNYGNGWNVSATPYSKLTDLNTGSIYPYLFWEGRGGIYNTPKKGFVVASYDIHNFLIEKLTKLGLNQKEQNDFIEFWKPRMTGAPYFFITFLGNKEMNNIAPLMIDPKPDSIIRILMDFFPLQKPIHTEGYEIKTPKRHGFTVVEWGGVSR